MAFGTKSAGLDNKAKAVIISVAAVIVILGGILIYLAIKANEDNKAAALKYNFNKYYPDTYNTVEELLPDADYDDDGIETGSTLCAAFCPHDMDVHLKDLLAIYIPRKMDGESLGITD